MLAYVPILSIGVTYKIEKDAQVTLLKFGQPGVVSVGSDQTRYVKMGDFQLASAAEQHLTGD